MRYLHFVGLPHQKIHHRFIHSVIGGEYVEYPCGIEQKHFPADVLSRDGKDVVWFFGDVYYNLHPLLQGKQVLIKHGLSFGSWYEPRRVECIKKWLYVFQTGNTKLKEHERLGLSEDRIRPLGYTLLFEVPKQPARPGAILFSSTCFRHWNHYDNLIAILERLDPAVDAYLSVHPETEPALLDRLFALCRSRPNLKPVRSQEELLETFAICSCNVSGGSSSVSAPFWYQDKPVIFLRGRYGWNPFRQGGIGWRRIKQEVDEPLFSRILDQSMKLSSWRDFNVEGIAGAKPAEAAREVFYPWNFDEHTTREKLIQLVAEVERAS